MDGHGQPLKIATWNVRTLYQAGKLDNCLQEMSRLNIDILGVAETRWTDAGAVDKEKYVMYFSGGNKHVNGVGIIIRKNLSRSIQSYIAKSERIIMMKVEGKPFDVVIIQAYAPTQDHGDAEVDRFYNEISECLDEVKGTDVLIIMGDFTAKVGSECTDEITGNYGLGERNDRGQRLVQFCQEENMTVSNTLF